MAKHVTVAGWDDVPHIAKEEQERLLQSIPPYQRDARSKGIPQLGAGAIYPVSEHDILVDPFEIPDYMPRAYGMDVGWSATAAMWGAHDKDNDIIYLYREYKRGQAEPATHTQAIQAPGKWIQGAIDPASRGRGQRDGLKLLDVYGELGLALWAADNAVEAGLYEVWLRLTTGRLKVFNSCRMWLEEFRLYRRDEKGKVVKQNDHLMDATRYLIMTPGAFLVTPSNMKTQFSATRSRSGWMGA